MRKNFNNKKHLKGTIASFDVAYSILLLTIALAYAYRIGETNFYAIKQDDEIELTKIYARTAADILVASDEFACEIQTQTGTSYKIPNCIDITKIPGNASTLKKKLLLPENFKVHVKIGASTFGDPWDDIVEPCSLTSSGSNCPQNVALHIPLRNVFSERRIVIASSGPLDKNKLYNCIMGKSCLLDKDKNVLEVYIWSENA